MYNNAMGVKTDIRIDSNTTLTPNCTLLKSIQNSRQTLYKEKRDVS